MQATSLFLNHHNARDFLVRVESVYLHYTYYHAEDLILTRLR